LRPGRVEIRSRVNVPSRDSSKSLVVFSLVRGL
jgi:hypothetical protein